MRLPRHHIALRIAMAFFAATPSMAAATGAGTSPEVAYQLPSGEQWLAHFTRDVLPYWTSPEALGEPAGRFPTFRYPDGQPIAAGELLRPEYREMSQYVPWLALRLDRTYTRMISRQAYVLGVAYHLTGDGRYLAWAKAAVGYVLGDLADGEGSFCSWIEDGECRPPPPHRTAQDQAYALLGPAFYAYLTGDAGVIEALVRAQRHLFAAYRDEPSGLLRWVLEASEDLPDRHAPEQVELVAQLDQINAYLLLLAPVVPEAEAARWHADLTALAELLVERFYDAEHNVFWGRIDAPEHRRLGGHHHTDTGHTAKTFWMLSRVARLAGDEAMARFAHDGGMRLLDAVFREDTGSWSDGWNADGSVKETGAWWGYAEADQLAATLALAEPRAARHLPRTYDFWLTYFVDHLHGGIWPFPVDPAAQPPVLKAHLWKNGYHEAEHALVGYVTGNALRREPVVLYFAPAAGRAPPALRPYFFDGRGETVRRLPLPALPGHERLEVRFTDVR